MASSTSLVSLTILQHNKYSQTALKEVAVSFTSSWLYMFERLPCTNKSDFRLHLQTRLASWKRR